MNKYKLAQQVDHALKNAHQKKNVIKGIGWKGHGHRYYTGGFIIITSRPKCVVVRHEVQYESLPLSLSMVDDSELTEKGIEHKQKIRNKTREAIEDYKIALIGFIFNEQCDEYDLPYLVITGKTEAQA